MNSGISNSSPQKIKSCIENRKRINFILIVITFASVTGCAKRPDIRVDGRPVLPREQVVRLGMHASEIYPGKPLNPHWGVDILSIDGKPIPKGTSVVQVEPGVHDFEYQCMMKFQINDTGGADGRGTVIYMIDSNPGFTFFPYATDQLSSYKRNSTGSIESTGTCRLEKFSTDNPFYHM